MLRASLLLVFAWSAAAARPDTRAEHAADVAQAVSLISGDS
jgi:hypothetical protein